MSNRRGSHVGPARLRFDFTHPKALDSEHIRQVERLVNDQIKKGVEVAARMVSRHQAEEAGATALFGEKYGEQVRIIDIPDFSLELCGGTHVGNTAEIGFFKILAESALASGVRRIEAATSVRALDFIDARLTSLETIERNFHAKGEALHKRLQGMREDLAEQERENEKLLKKIQTLGAAGMFADMGTIGSTPFKHVEAEEGDDIRTIGHFFTDKHPRGVALMTKETGGKLAVLLVSSNGIDCSCVLKKVLHPLGGRGGGKATGAQGSVTIAHKKELVENLIVELERLLA